MTHPTVRPSPIASKAASKAKECRADEEMGRESETTWDTMVGVVSTFVRAVCLIRHTCWHPTTKEKDDVENQQDECYSRARKAASWLLRIFQVWNVSWWVCIFFVLGSLTWVWSGALMMWPERYAPPGLEEKEAKLSSYFLSARIAVPGSALFELGSVFAVLEAINKPSASDFGAQVMGVCSRSGPQRPSRWRWWTADLNEEYAFTAMTQLIGTTLFLMASIASMPLGEGQPTLLGESPSWQAQEVFVLLPQSIACMLFTSASVRCLRHYSKPGQWLNTESLDWQANFWFLLGSLAFLVSSLWGEIDGYLGPAQHIPGFYAANCVAVFYGAIFFLVGSLTTCLHVYKSWVVKEEK